MAKKKLQGQVAIVTGGGRGIGAATAERLTAMGASVVLAARSDEEVEAVASRLRVAAEEKALEAALPRLTPVTDPTSVVCSGGQTL